MLTVPARPGTPGAPPLVIPLFCLSRLPLYRLSLSLHSLPKMVLPKMTTIKTYDTLEVQEVDGTEGKVIYVWLNQPKSRNACSYELLEDIAAAYTDLSTNFDARVIVMAGRGKTFCAGANLKSPPTKGDGSNLKTFREVGYTKRVLVTFHRVLFHRHATQLHAGFEPGVR